MKVIEYPAGHILPDCNAWTHVSTLGALQSKKYLHAIGEEAIISIGQVHFCEKCIAHYIQSFETSRKVRLHVRV